MRHCTHIHIRWGWERPHCMCMYICVHWRMCSGVACVCVHSAGFRTRHAKCAIQLYGRIPLSILHWGVRGTARIHRGVWQRCSLCLLYWYKSTNTGALVRGAARMHSGVWQRCSLCLLYWYKSTNTDATRAPQMPLASLPRALARNSRSAFSKVREQHTFLLSVPAS